MFKPLFRPSQEANKYQASCIYKLTSNEFLFSGSNEIVKVLLDDFTNIKVDIRNKMGFTALMKAAIQGRTCCAKLLLYAGKV